MPLSKHNSSNGGRLRSTSARIGLALSLVLPASALAAPGAEAPAVPDSPPRERAQRADEEGTAAGTAVALISGFGVGSTVDLADAGPFHPVDGPVDYGSVEAAFGNARGRPHEGQDIFAPSGTPVVSPTPTTVVETGGGDDRGNWAAVYDATADRTYVYFHMLEPAEVRAGQRLAPGDRVGIVGCTGSCYGEHLHFEMRDGRDPYGTPRDPMPLLTKWQRLPSD